MARILVDTSVWIEFFRGDENSLLEELIREDLLVTNELILTEILPHARHLGEVDLIDGMLAIPKIELDLDWHGIRNLQALNLKNGVNKVGIPDLIIAQQALQYSLEIWTRDKHFQLMQEYLDLRLV